MAKRSRGQVGNLQTTAAFNILYERTHLNVYRFIYGLHGGPTEEVEDLTATTFLRAWKARHQYKGNLEAALGWLLQIARNLVIDTHRHQTRRGSSQDIEKHILPDPAKGPEENLADRETFKTLWTLIDNLSVRQREIIVLRYILGWRVKQIAVHLEMSENTVSVNIRRSLQRIRQNWPTT